MIKMHIARLYFSLMMIMMINLDIYFGCVNICIHFLEIYGTVTDHRTQESCYCTVFFFLECRLLWFIIP